MNGDLTALQKLSSLLSSCSGMVLCSTRYPDSPIWVAPFPCLLLPWHTLPLILNFHCRQNIMTVPTLPYTLSLMLAFCPEQDYSSPNLIILSGYEIPETILSFDSNTIHFLRWLLLGSPLVKRCWYEIPADYCTTLGYHWPCWVCTK